MLLVILLWVFLVCCLLKLLFCLCGGWDPASGADYDADMDPRFIDRDSAEYVHFGKGLLNGFSSIVASSGRKDKSVDFFLPFVNAGGSIRPLVESGPWP